MQEMDFERKKKETGGEKPGGVLLHSLIGKRETLYVSEKNTSICSDEWKRDPKKPKNNLKVFKYICHVNQFQIIVGFELELVRQVCG